MAQGPREGARSAQPSCRDQSRRTKSATVPLALSHLHLPVGLGIFRDVENIIDCRAAKAENIVPLRCHDYIPSEAKPDIRRLAFRVWRLAFGVV